MTENIDLDDLRPIDKPTVMELVQAAGLDVSAWADSRGSAAANPKYCFEWCFEGEGLFVFNLWFDEMKVKEGKILQRLNLRRVANQGSGHRENRARRFDDAASKAYTLRSPVRALIQDRPSIGKPASMRGLDRAPWSVTHYEASSGDFTLRRGVQTLQPVVGPDDWDSGAIEGQLSLRLTRHRRREGQLRDRKLEAHRRANSGRLICEVVGCDFDFAEVYGPLGDGYAQVHHLTPLAKLRHEGEEVRLDDLAVVCANCHAMIHRGGGCRALDSLIAWAD